ncbi:MAG: hypothetical protein H8E35_05870 [Ardenticatenia bacterium]|nr:hypothetical protein [Ardenticatenia bacterium]
MPVAIPEAALQYGFIIDGLGAHSSRTMMLKELRLLLAACPPITDMEGYRSATLDENVLLKQTVATRKESFRRLREMYGLDPDLLLFRALLDLWDQTPKAQPLLTLLCATARDPMLRASAQVILDAPLESLVAPQMISQSIDDQFPGRLNPTTLANIGRHTASSWTQTGHLRGRTNKVRARAKSHPTSVAYALLLGHLCDVRGEALFHTLWARLLDAPIHTLQEQAILASQQGWLEYRQSGAVTEITFDYLLREKDKEPAT